MQITNRVHYRFLLIILGLVVLCAAASATENGASVWPVGAESVAIAAGVPHTGQTYVYEYTMFYAANQLDDAKGKKLPIPDFKVRAFAVAVKLSHNWGVKFLGGELGSYVAVPQVYEQLHLPGGKFTKDDITNINVVPFTVFNHKGMVHWLYELEFETLGTGYSPVTATNPMNIGQHNVALTPAFAITLTPHKGEQEVSARFDYVINDIDHVTHYHSGNEFFTQFDARQEILHRKASVGLIGYFYQQTTGDHCGADGATFNCVRGAVVTTNADGTQSVGYKGRVLDLGPQVTLPWGKHGALIFKMDHDMLVQNKTRGNSFWFEFGVPFSYLHHPASEK